MAFVKSVPEKEESVFAVLRRYPKHAVLITELADNVMRSGECSFTAEQRELIGAYTSGTNDCTYCYDTHKAPAAAFGESSIDFKLRFWIDDPQSGLTNIRGKILLALWDTFKEHGIGIPFPHREVIMKTPVTVEQRS